MIKQTVTVYILILTEHNIKVIGKMINKKVMEKKHGLTVLLMKENINKEKKMDMAFLNGLMGVLIWGILRIIVLMGLVLIRGEIKECILVIGKIIKWMEKEFLLGLIKEGMRGDIRMIKKKDMEFLNGEMGKSIGVIGKMVSKMGKGNFIMSKLKLGESV